MRALQAQGRFLDDGEVVMFDPSIYPFPPMTKGRFIASKWQLFIARLFGQTFDEWHGHHHVVAHLWRGKLYIRELSSGPRA